MSEKLVVPMSPGRADCFRTALCFVMILTLIHCGGCGGPPTAGDSSSPAAASGASAPVPGSPAYESFVTDFYIGLAALQVDNPPKALEKLTRATQAVPEEPAAWANLGLAHLRANDLPKALATLEKAAALAPRSGPIQGLLALVEKRRGKVELVVSHLRKAVELAPDDLRARFALLRELDRPGTSATTADLLGHVSAILTKHPQNLVALLERLRLSAKAGDAGTYSRTFDDLEKLSRPWPEEARTELAALKAAPSGTGDGTEMAFLQHALEPVAAYQSSLAMLEVPRSVIGEPLVTMLILEAPRPGPPPADPGLTFTLDPAGPPSQSITLMWPTGDVSPRLVSADTARVLEPPLTFPGGGKSPSVHGLTAADLNNDFRSDLVLSGAGGLILALQDDKGQFVPAPPVAGSFGRSWVIDLELDGDLDLVAASPGGPTVALLNTGAGKFEPHPGKAFAGVSSARDFAWADLDGEGTPDAAFVDGSGRVRVFVNERAGQYREVNVDVLPKELPCVALTVGDADGDGRVDLFILGTDGSVRSLHSRPEGWRLESLFKSAGSFDHILCIELDNNGVPDLVLSGAAGSRLFLSDLKAWAPVELPQGFQVVTAADLDGNGRVDLVGRDGAGARRVARSTGTKGYHWQAMRPRGSRTATGDGRINSFGFGGELELRAGLMVGKQVVTSPAVHFGLGERRKGDVVRVSWPNGTVQGEFELPGDSSIVAEQRLKGSCPWVFAHDGTTVNFVTDFLWRSPLGLKINAVDTAGVAQTEDWVRIRGDQLAPVNGVYDIRITAELWETHFFDHVFLKVIDHPPGTEVFVDERFSPRQPPRLEVVTLGPLRPPAWARDDRDRDVSVAVRALDGDYLDGIDRGPYQGITRDHWVELPAPRGDDDWLVARGWVHPTDSSINVAIGQGGRVRPQGLVLEALGADGAWRPVLTDLGFPAGKNKSILVPLGAVKGSRIRLRTNMEIYWDALAFACSAPAISRIAGVPIRSAQLRYRGYSRVDQASPAAPELPRYNELGGTSPRWRDLEGFHTRFGDVLELLTKVDDRTVIMNAGDEMALTFPVPAGPTAGWSRDFVLVGDGWEKDGDFNTAFSRTVLPLPSHDNPAYGTAVGSLAADPVHRRHAADWRTYHTRYVTPARMAAGLPRSVTP